MGETLLEQMSADGLGDTLTGKPVTLTEYPGEIVLA